MILDTLKSANRVIGIKQVAKAVKRGNVRQVFVADDADERVVEPIRMLCREYRIPVEQSATMQEIGQACGIEVGAAAVALLE